ncbi:MAG: hypothetical protein QG636_458 [Patescibacteria group bacterium]|nr:hypothetical protein [Patescibacteria group bacterium]
MSRALSGARRDFEAANVLLEDVILSEIDTGTPAPASYRECLSTLETVLVGLDLTVDLTRQLETEMKTKGYAPLPAFVLLNDVTIRDFGAEMANAGLLRIDAFAEVALPQLTEHGFYGALRVIREDITALRTVVDELKTEMSAAIRSAEAGNIADILETNSAQNFRIRFLQTYVSWNRSYDLFLASASFSTELWYRSMGHGSMLGTGGELQATA